MSFQSRELEIAVMWRDWRQMCAVKFLRLEDFLVDRRHGITIHLEPQGILFAEVSFLTRILPIVRARCSSAVRAFAHGAMGRRIDPSWGGPIELFLVPASAP